MDRPVKRKKKPSSSSLSFLPRGTRIGDGLAEISSEFPYEFPQREFLGALLERTLECPLLRT